jgi:DNA modification methylase
MTVESNKIYCGDALEVLRAFPDESVNCVATSPPYYGLRDYNVSGQIGLEDSPEEYIGRLATVFMECWRVLKADGTFWLVIGDSYAGSGRGKGDISRKGIQQKASFVGDMFDKPYRLTGYKNKDLMGIPWALAFALRSKGWYLRQDIIWHKNNPMLESVRDRCTKAHEYVFLLTKSAKYYFDHEAMLEPANYDGRKKLTHAGSAKYINNGTGIGVQNISKGSRSRWPNKIRGYVSKEGLTLLPEQHHGGNIMPQPARNKRSVWTVPTKAFKEAHFATFPPDLIRACIEAGCPPDGVVLDPFMGAGTTAAVSQELGRNYIGIELNADYVRIAERRVKKRLV